MVHPRDSRQSTVPKRSPVSSQRRPSLTRLGLVVIFLAVGLAVYGGTLSRPLGSDASFLTGQNRFVLDEDGLGKFWTTDFFQGAITTGVPYISGYYRPVTNSLFWFEYRLGNDRPAFYRLMQLLLHVTSALLVVILCSRVFDKRIVGALAGGLMLLHPVNAFAATEPAARADVLLSVFYLAGMIAFDRALAAETRRARWGALTLTTLCCALAILSKEPGITMPAALVLLVLFRKGGDGIPWKQMTLTLPAWSVAGVYVVWRFGMLDLMPSSFGYEAEHSQVMLLLAALKGIAIHVSRIALPLGPTYPELNPWLVNYVDTSLREPLTYIAIAAVAAACYLALNWRKYPVPALWSGFFLVAYAPLMRVDNIQGTLSTNTVLAQERWIYLPAVAVFAALAWWMAQWLEGPLSRRRRIGLAVGALALAVFLGGSAFQHAGRHEDPYARLRQVYLVPEERLSRFERANKLLLYSRWVAAPRGEWDEAEARSREAYRIVPDSPIMAASLAAVLGQKGQWGEVVTVLDPWLEPSVDQIRGYHQSNTRVGDDLNRVGGDVALLLAEAKVHLGPAGEAAHALCESARRQANPERILQALVIAYVQFGPDHCHAAGDPAVCTARAVPPTGPAWRPPFDQTSCHVWTESLRDGVGASSPVDR